MLSNDGERPVVIGGALCITQTIAGAQSVNRPTKSSRAQFGRPKPVSGPSSSSSTAIPTHTGRPVATAASVAQTE